MAQHAVCFELAGNRNAGSLGINPQSVITGEVNDLGINGAGPIYTSNALPWPIIPPSAHGPQALAPAVGPVNTYTYKVTGMVATAAGPPVPAGPQAGVYCYVSNGDEYFWVVNGVAFSNGVVAPVHRIGPAFLSGRLSPDEILEFSADAGAALQAALAPGNAVAAHLHLEWRYPLLNPYSNLSHLIEFAEVPPDVIPGGLSVPSAELSTVLGLTLGGLQLRAGGRYELGVANGQTIYANACGFAGIAPEGTVYIRPEDFGGAQADRIPLDYQDNEASRFRFHPSVFVRRPQYFRGVSAPYADPVAIDQIDAASTQVMRIITVDADPNYSNWLIIIDGQPQVVRLTHPAGSDLRRPRDIWNQLWVPIINGSNAASRSVELALWAAPGGFGVSAGPQVVLDRARFIEYARCLPLNGTPQDQNQPN